MAKSKLMTADEAVACIKDGAVIMVGGFMTCGTPEPVMEALERKGVKNLTVICNDAGYPGKGTGRLVKSGQAKKIIVSHVGLNPEVAERMNNGTLEVVLVPQGTLAERIRAAGAGLGGVITPTGVGTIIADGKFEPPKQTLKIDGKDYLLEPPIHADVAILGGTVCDEFGNTVFKGTTRNFNPLMAAAADYVIAGAEKVVKTGELDPDAIHVSGIFVDAIVGGK
ncbi:MAG: CoA transferase subunit A [Treponemataceae bacterium]|nr:MAG: CoA transferase subunit A [Treponemataceae bacterium]